MISGLVDRRARETRQGDVKLSRVGLNLEVFVVALGGSKACLGANRHEEPDLKIVAFAFSYNVPTFPSILVIQSSFCVVSKAEVRDWPIGGGG